MIFNQNYPRAATLNVYRVRLESRFQHFLPYGRPTTNRAPMWAAGRGLSSSLVCGSVVEFYLQFVDKLRRGASGDPISRRRSPPKGRELRQKFIPSSTRKTLLHSIEVVAPLSESKADDVLRRKQLLLRRMTNLGPIDCGHSNPYRGFFFSLVKIALFPIKGEPIGGVTTSWGVVTHERHFYSAFLAAI